MAKAVTQKKSSSRKRAPGQGRAKAKVAAAKRAAALAAKSGNAGDFGTARKLAGQAAAAVQAVNRRTFERLAGGYISTAVRAMDKLAVLCERRRKYRVIPEDVATYLKPLQEALEELGYAIDIALNRKRVAPSAAQLIPRKSAERPAQLDLVEAGQAAGGA